MKTAIRLGIVVASSLLGAYAIAVWRRNGSGGTTVGGDVYAGMFVIPSALAFVALISLFGRRDDNQVLRAGSIAIPVIVLIGWALVAGTGQVISHAGAMAKPWGLSRRVCDGGVQARMPGNRGSERTNRRKSLAQRKGAIIIPLWSSSMTQISPPRT